MKPKRQRPLKKSSAARTRGLKPGVLTAEIRQLIESARHQVAQVVNAGLTALYWQIGTRIRQDILRSRRAAYGGEMVATLRRQLSWAHFKTLIPIKEPLKRDFYAEMCRVETWSTRVLQRKIEGFLLELGSGFSFLERQKRITLDGDDYYMDLLFYHRRLRRLVLIELKLGDFKPADSGQVELYLRWLDRHERQPGEEPPLAIILCAGKKRETVEYLDLGRSGIHVAEYLTALPPRKILRERFHQAIATARTRLERLEAIAGRKTS